MPRGLTQIKVESLVQKGEGLGHTRDGKVVFVSGALGGETVLARITEQKRDFSRAVAEQILKPSPDRVVPVCPYYGICGGCDLMHLSAPAQIREKQRIVTDTLLRFRAIDPDGGTVIEPPATGSELGYRTRVRLRIAKAGDNLRAGFSGRSSNDFVPVEHCPVLDPQLDALLRQPESLLPFARDGQVPVCLGDEGPLLGDGTGHVTILGRRLPLSNGSFFQSNLSLLPEMIEYVVSNVTGVKVMDLYSGIGVFSAFVEDRFETLAVERDRRCLNLARSHLKRTRFFTDSVEDFSLPSGYDTVIVDPPRVGLDPKVPAMLARSGARKIIYVSCDSVTMARDVSRLRSLGYRLGKVRLFDFYPQTHHVETVVLMLKCN